MAFNPIVIEKGLSARFAQAMMNFQAARELAPGLMATALQAPSTGAYEKYGWLGAMPAVSQWLGERNSKEFKDYDYTIKNKDWETSVPVFENDWDDDQTGSYDLIPAMLAKKVMTHPEKLISDLVIDGDTALAYDGIAFFSDVSAPRDIDNLLAGTGTSLAQLKADLIAALTAQAKFPDDQGSILNITGNVIYCPIALQYLFESLVYSTADPTASGGVNTFNPFHNKFTIIGDARLDADDANDWYLFATNEVVKPFIWQLRQGAKPSMEKTNHTKQWVFGSDYRGNGGYGIPHLGVKTVNS